MSLTGCKNEQIKEVTAYTCELLTPAAGFLKQDRSTSRERTAGSCHAVLRERQLVQGNASAVHRAFEALVREACFTRLTSQLTGVGGQVAAIDKSSALI